MEKRSLQIITSGYLFLILYGTLFPLQNWQWHSTSLSLMLDWPEHISRSDVFLNYFIYIPLGFLVVALLRPRVSLFLAVVIASLAGTCLSILLEFGQSFLSSRHSTIVDVLLNGAGMFTGAVISAAISLENPQINRFIRFYNRLFRPSVKINVALTVIVLWLFKQLMPLVPSFDKSDLLYGIRPILAVLHQPGSFDWLKSLIYLLSVITLTLIISSCVREKKYLSRRVGLLVFFVLSIKIIIISRQLSLEAVLGALAGLLVFRFLLKGRNHYSLIIIFSIFGVLLLEALHLDNGRSSVVINSINWIPFSYQLQSKGFHFSDLFLQMWPYAVLSYAILYFDKRDYSVNKPLYSGVCVLLLGLAMECMQQLLPGHYFDITNIILALAGWLVVLVIFQNASMYSGKSVEINAGKLVK